MTQDLKKLLDLVDKTIAENNFGQHPQELYEPIHYILSLGGKRMRPLLTLLAYSLYKQDVEKALKPSVAVEVFHNFTLMHDDIMDQAPLRRGKVTVHEKWNANVAILSGDVMMVRAYDLLLDVDAHLLKQVISDFNKTAAEVCEGQQIDMNFESRTDVSEGEYLDMIKLKTAVLLGFSLKLGAILAGAPKADAEALYQLGVNVGIGFQLKDDLLDVYADQAKFGKQVGGDIISNKKTFLLINAFNSSVGETKKNLQNWLERKDFNKEEKVKAVTDIYNLLNIKQLTEFKIEEYFSQGFEALEKLELSEDKKAPLRTFFKDLIEREK